MKEVLAILQNAQANLAELADELEDADLIAEEINAYLEVKGRLAQAVAILETASAQGVF